MFTFSNKQTWKRIHKGLLNLDSMSCIELCVYNRDKSWPRMPIGQYRKLKKCFIQMCGDSYHGRGCDSYHGRSDCNRRLKCWWSGIPILPTLRILWDTEIGLFRFLFLNFYYSGHQLLVGGNEVLFFSSEWNFKLKNREEESPCEFIAISFSVFHFPFSVFCVLLFVFPFQFSNLCFLFSVVSSV